MGLCVVILMVAFGLGFVIFVHELGHFLVAKLCGVKCEKFYLGFDIAGLKLCKFRWGETEYGIGILPLGGYVKMLGQEDNPAKLREEMERAKQAAGDEGQGTGGSPPSETREEPDSNPQSPAPAYDPRSFLAQSVPKRMAIISAGVIMNVVFAFLMAVVAFSMGVEQTPCVIGAVFPGEPAWQANLRPGDEILEIAGKKMTQFRDLMAAISLGDIDLDRGVSILVRRPGVEEPFMVVVKPYDLHGALKIGVSNGYTTQLMPDKKTWLVQKRHAVYPGSVADLADPPFRNGDRIVQIDDVPIDNYAQINTELARKPDQQIVVTVERSEKDADGKPTGKTEHIAIPVARNPMRILGLVMKIGEVTAVQADSPAAAAGIMPGDLIRKVNGNPVADPMTLPARLNAAAGESVELTIQRETSKTPLVVSLQAREPVEFSSPMLVNSPVAISSLGVAYQVLNRVDSVIAESPAAKAGLLPEDLIVEAKLIPPSKETLRALKVDQAKGTVRFTEEERNWPSFLSTLQEVLPGTTVELTVSRQEEERTVKLTPVEAADWFNPNRGFNFKALTFVPKVDSVGDALAMGGQETFDALTIVFRTVGALSTSQVSPRNLGGPWMIIKTALLYADQGSAKLLLFLTLLSANLAVLNFLPIPLLDGGLMVFLIYEGIRGKPADERVQVVLTYLGLIFIIALMLWVFGLDLGLIPRR